MAAGDIAIYADDAGGDIYTVAGFEMPWDTTAQEDSIYTLNVATTRTEVSEAGHYLAIYNLTIVITNPAPISPTRAVVNTTLQINGTPTAYGRSSGYYRGISHVNEEGGLHGAAILDLSANDEVGVLAARSDTAGTNGNCRRRDNKDGGSRLTLIRLNDDWDYLRLRNTTSLASSTTSFQDYTFNTQDEIDAAYSHTTGTGSVTIEETGLYMVFFNCDMFSSSASNRASIEGRMVVDTGGGFVEEEGTRVTSYHRGLSSCRTSTITYKGMHEFDADDIFKFQYRHENAGATSAQPIGLFINFTMSVVQLPDSAEVFRIHESGAGTRADTDADIDFDTTDREDTASFDHQAAPPDEVDANEDMYALLFCTFYAESAVVRNGSRVQNTVHYMINGTKAGGAVSDAGHSHNFAYNRGLSGTGVEAAGASQCGLVDAEIDSGDTIVFRNESPGTGADANVTFNADRIAAHGLNLGTIFPVLESIDEDVDIDEGDNRAISRSCPEDMDVDEAVNRAVFRSQGTDVFIDENSSKNSGISGNDVVDVDEGVNREVNRSQNTDVNIRSNVPRRFEINRSVDTDVFIDEEAERQPGFVAEVSSVVEIDEEVNELTEMIMVYEMRLDSASAGTEAMDSHEET